MGWEGGCCCPRRGRRGGRAGGRGGWAGGRGRGVTCRALARPAEEEPGDACGSRLRPAAQTPPPEESRLRPQAGCHPSGPLQLSSSSSFSFSSSSLPVPPQDCGDTRGQRGRGQTEAPPLSVKVPVHLGEGQPGGPKLRPLPGGLRCPAPAQLSQEDSPQARERCQDNQIHLGLLLIRHSVAEETALPKGPGHAPEGCGWGRG